MWCAPGLTSIAFPTPLNWLTYPAKLSSTKTAARCGVTFSFISEVTDEYCALGSLSSLTATVTFLAGSTRIVCVSVRYPLCRKETSCCPGSSMIFLSPFNSEA